MKLHHKNKPALPVLLAILILVGAGIWYRDTHRGSIQTMLRSSTILAAQSKEVQTTNMLGSGKVQILKGLPVGVPVEREHIIENYKAVYEKRNMTQYTVSYTTDKPQGSLWKTYELFFKAEGFVLDAADTNQTVGTLVGTKDNDTLTVALVSQSAKLILVHINFLDRYHEQ